MRGVYLKKCQITLKISFQNSSVALDKVSVHSIFYAYSGDMEKICGQGEKFFCPPYRRIQKFRLSPIWPYHC